MPLTKDFSDTIRARALRDPGFGRGLPREAIECLLGGEVGTGQILLRDYINATMGFEALSQATGIHTKSLMRMFGPRGNPQARNLFEVIGHLQQAEGVHIEATMRRGARKAS